MSKRKKVWAVRSADGDLVRVSIEPFGKGYGFPGETLVELVPRDPSAEALIRAVRKVRYPPDELFDVLERYEKAHEK